ncbi:hypothetical protein GGX14DRAFT_382146, partial [Mycena pura]
CFPHVVNIAVKTGLKELIELPDYQPDIVLDNNGNMIPQSARSLVTACRASGQRRDAFENTIKEGNKEGGFGDPREVLRVVGLLKVETRWSATFLMMDRSTWCAVNTFLDDPKQDEISWRRLSAVELKVLEDIRRFLQVPHIVQEIVSAEKTPTLSMVLPMYENLILMLKQLAKELDELSIGINASIRKLEEYLNMSRRTKMYALAMGKQLLIKAVFIEILNSLPSVLNPTIKGVAREQK